MEKNKLIPLLRLLDDNDRQVYDAVRKKILSEGIEIIPEMESYQAQTPNKTVRNRIKNIIHTLRFKTLSQEIKQWALSPENDILYGAFLVAKYQYPHLDFASTENKIAGIVNLIKPEINDYLTALQQIRVVNHIIYDVFKLTTNPVNDFSPENAFINDVLSSRHGNHIAASILYLSVTSRLGLPIHGVNLQKNFIVAYIDDKKKINTQEIDVLFYINPFNKGAVLSKKEIDNFLMKSKIESLPEYYYPCDHNKVIGRLISSLLYSYKQKGNSGKIKEIEKLFSFFSENFPGKYDF
jgi:regulator of sirC expression with transglutaminase-like and TPR domain